MTILEISQLIFNVVFSLVAIAVGIVTIVLLREITRAVQAVKKMADNIRQGSAQLQERVGQMAEHFWLLPMISKFFIRKVRKREEEL